MKNYFKNIFDENNPEFVNALDELPFWSAPFGLTLLDTVKIKPGTKALDIGCGTGFPLFELAGRLGDSCRIYGLDAWDRAISKVNSRINLYQIKNIEAVNCEAENLPFENNFFDLIVSNNGINNVRDLDKTLSECFRTLKPGGQFVFTYNLPDSLKEFYSVFKSTLGELGLLAEIQKTDEHIFAKRKPLDFMEKAVTKNNFKITNKTEKEFRYRFSDGTAFFNHSMFKFFFLPPWRSLLPEKRAEEVFAIVEEKFNILAAEKGELVMTIPYACFDCEK